MLLRNALILILLFFPALALAGKPAPVRIVFATPSEDTQGATRTLINRYNRMKTGIEVKLYPLSSSSDAIHNTYVTAFLAKDPSFDVIAADVIWSPEFGAASWVEPLDPYFLPSERVKFLPMTIKTCTYQDRIWAVPWFTDTGLLFYRKDLIASPPQNWTALIALARKALQRGAVPYGLVFQGNQYEGLVCNTLEFIWSNGGEVWEGGKPAFNTPRAKQALQFMADLVKTGIAPPAVTGFQEEDARLFFQDGKALFLRHWPNTWAAFNNPHSRIRGKVGIAALPAGPSGSQGTGCLGGWNLMINRYSRNKRAAWEFIQYMTGVAGQKLNATVAGRLPTRYAVYRDPLVLRENPYFPQFLPSILRSRTRPISTFYPALSEIMQNYFYQNLSGQISAQTTVSKIETEMRAAIEH